jgi:hypothetical protein
LDLHEGSPDENRGALPPRGFVAHRQSSSKAGWWIEHPAFYSRMCSPNENRRGCGLPTAPRDRIRITAA